MTSCFSVPGEADTPQYFQSPPTVDSLLCEITNRDEHDVAQLAKDSRLIFEVITRGTLANSLLDPNTARYIAELTQKNPSYMNAVAEVVMHPSLVAIVESPETVANQLDFIIEMRIHETHIALRDDAA